MSKKIITRCLTILAALGISMILHGSTAKAAADFTEITPVKASNREEIESLVNASEKAVAGGSIQIIKENKKIVESKSAYFKFVMPEDGIVYLRYSLVQSEQGKYLNTGITLYGDKNLIDIKYDEKTISETSSKEFYVALKKGTYYLEAAAKDSYGFAETSTNRVGIAAAYIPVSGKTTDFKVEFSETKTTTDDIVVTVITADPDAVVWSEPGTTSSLVLGNSFHWTSSLLCQDKTFTVTKNGEYTIQVGDSLGNYSMKTIVIKNIDNKKPTTPVLKNYKVNATSISGTADAGTMIYVKIGSKTQTVIARDDNTFTLKVAKLAKGSKITVYAKDNAGNKSNSKNFTVK